MRQRCGTCEAEYDTITKDGMLYFHACSPVAMVRVLRDDGELAIPLADLKPTDRIRVEREGKTIDVPAGEMGPGDIRVGDHTEPRPDARNENVDPTRRGSPHPIVAEGRGAVRVR